MRARLSRLFLRPEPPSVISGLVVTVIAVAAITALIYPLRQISPAESNGVAYLLAVLLVSTLWGLRMGLAASLLSAAAFNYFHLPPTGRFTIADSRHWVALGVFLVAAVVATARRRPGESGWRSTRSCARPRPRSTRRASGSRSPSTATCR